MSNSIPQYPTHTVMHIDNWDGQGDVIYSLAFKVDDVFYHYISPASKILEYEGDEILQVWNLDVT